MEPDRVPPLPPDVQMRIAESFRLGRVSECHPVHSGVMNLSWQLTTDRGDFAVKRLTDGSPETFRATQELLPRLAGLGFPVPGPYRTGTGETLLKINGFRYAVSEWLRGAHPSGAALDPGVCTALGDLIGRLHLALAHLCPPAPARLPDVPLTAARARAELERYRRLDDGTFAGQIDRRLQLLEEVADRRPAEQEVGPCGWTHGDLNPFNLLLENGQVTGILDWDRRGVRPYGLEVVRTATILFSAGGRTALDLDRTAAFARGYRARIPITDNQLADAADRRWWTLATETWPLRRRYDDGDHSCDHLFAARDTFVHWWTGHRREVTAALLGEPG